MHNGLSNIDKAKILLEEMKIDDIDLKFHIALHEGNDIDCTLTIKNGANTNYTLESVLAKYNNILSEYDEVTKHLTMYKNNSRDNSKIKGCSPLQLASNLEGKCHAIGYYSYTIRWQ